MINPIKNKDGTKTIMRSVGKGVGPALIIRLMGDMGFEKGDQVKITQDKEGRAFIEKINI